MTSCPASWSRPATTLLSTPPDMATTIRINQSPRSALGVAGRRRQFDHQTIEALGHDNLASKPRGLRQPKRQIKHILLVFGRSSKFFEPVRLDDDMTGRTGQGALASTLNVYAVLVRDLQHRQ